MSELFKKYKAMWADQHFQKEKHMLKHFVNIAFHLYFNGHYMFSNKILQYKKKTLS